ncbi:hypothetical protein [Thermomonospora amylolytica]|uniref:hypothetical protein n=1 Tax=Thermomonospora amylolytica TaxID=1411117 RepID=UPI0018E5995D|nr:hypothetical protein [Thermomonospora amylolytica]
MGELARLVADFRADVREDFNAINARLDTYVLREVYAADKEALLERLGRLEREAEAARASARAAVWAAAGGVFATIIGGVILALLLKGGPA